MPSTVTSRAPGKLILSGEHAVVHGAPALAMAVTRSLAASWTAVDTDTLTVQLPDQAPLSVSLADLAAFREAAGERLRAYRNGTADIRSVLPGPHDLIRLTVANTPPATGGLLQIQGDIPIGSGMGSSAALILVMLHALCPEPNQDPDLLFRTALHCEHYQHGRSSGLDLYTSLHGGVVQLEGGLFSETDAHPPQFRLFHSGTPVSSTGECVSAVHDQFAGDKRLWRDFSSVTRDMRTALNRGDPIRFRDTVRANHRLLCHIGVVPPPIRNLVRRLEQQGAAAKICGAGSVRGDRAGLVLVAAPHDLNLQDLTGEFGLKPLLVGMSRKGLHRQ